MIKLKDIDVWHDRAVLHFFTEKHQQEAYFQLLKKVIKLNGFDIDFNNKSTFLCEISLPT